MTTPLERSCLAIGLRLSRQRRAVLQILEEAKDHLSAEEIYKRAARLERGLGVATVYRTLNILVAAGLLTRLERGDRKARYERASSGHHEYLIDVETGRILDLRHEEFAAVITAMAARLGYRLLDYRLELLGLSAGSGSNLESKEQDLVAGPASSSSPTHTPSNRIALGLPYMSSPAKSSQPHRQRHKS